VRPASREKRTLTHAMTTSWVLLGAAIAASAVQRATSILSLLSRAPPGTSSEDGRTLRDAHVSEVEGARRYAIALYGGVTGMHARFGEHIPGVSTVTSREAERGNKSTVNLSIPAIMLKENLLGGPADVFIHSWNPNFRNTLERLYHPIAAQFENNEDDMPEIKRMTDSLPHGGRHSPGHIPFPSLGHVSMTRSIAKVLKLVVDYQEATGHVYDSVYLCRPDVMLLGKVNLNRSAVRYVFTGGKLRGRVPPVNMGEDVVFNSYGMGGNSDFHYLMSGRHVKAFSTIYDSLPTVTKPILAHSGWVREFLQQNKLRLVSADTVTDGDEEVYRKMDGTMSRLRPEWNSFLAPLMPPQCLDQLFSHKKDISDDCLVDM